MKKFHVMTGLEFLYLWNEGKLPNSPGPLGKLVCCICGENILTWDCFRAIEDLSIHPCNSKLYTYVCSEICATMYILGKV